MESISRCHWSSLQFVCIVCCWFHIVLDNHNSSLVQMKMLSCIPLDDHWDTSTPPSSADGGNNRLTSMISYIWRDNFHRLLPLFHSHTAVLNSRLAKTFPKSSSIIFTTLTLIWHCIKVHTWARSTTCFWTITRTWSRTAYGIVQNWWRNVSAVAIAWLNAGVCVLLFIIWFTEVYTRLWGCNWTGRYVKHIVIITIVMIVWEAFTVKNITLITNDDD